MSHSLLQPPWSGQPANRFCRILAYVFVFFAVVALFFLTYFGLQQGVAVSDLPLVIGATIGISYLAAVFFRVAIAGKAPTTWVPWS